MKKKNKVLMAVFACVAVCAVSIPAIGANMQKTTVSMEQVVYTRNSGLEHAVLDQKVVYPNELEENTKDIEPADETEPQDVPETDEANETDDTEKNSIAAEDDPTGNVNVTYTPETDVPEEAPVDVPEEAPADVPEETPADVVDTGAADTAATPVCPYYVDNNGDGVCDHCAHGNACGNYVDSNWDGYCDYCSHNGSGHCGSYVDSNGDGYCDNYTGGSSGSGGGHHGRHHGGHHW